ncbi:P27 family phage terminase small subunit [Streptomyces microflavus]|uniref:P27 family phage terminase small subunit n=1 Tax=Streptomyces microflavus TaxID=1919 RepID=UPI000399AD9A|nr:P27 family phage terminase small subunit [Streptomyces microflavus]
MREGNPGHRPVKEGAKLPPSELIEPPWTAFFPDIKPGRKPRAPRGADEEQLREYKDEVAAWMRLKLAAESAEAGRTAAAREWSRVVPQLVIGTGLGAVDRSVIVDYCVCVARLEWIEYRLSVEGLITMGQRGPCRNPLTTVASQYRTQLKAYIGELGLSPSARGRIPPPEGGHGDDDGDVFD